MELVKFVNAIGHGIGERIFLRVQRAGFDHGDGLGQVHGHRHGAEQIERAPLDLARQHADLHALEIGGQMHRSQPVGDMAEAVLEPAENAEVELLLGLARKERAEFPVHGRARLRIAGEQKRQVDKTQFRHAVGQIARRLVTEGEHSMLDQPQDVLGLQTEVHHIPDIFDVDPIAEFAL